jgi:hypothetical protein
LNVDFQNRNSINIIPFLGPLKTRAVEFFDVCAGYVPPTVDGPSDPTSGNVSILTDRNNAMVKCRIEFKRIHAEGRENVVSVQAQENIGESLDGIGD